MRSSSSMIRHHTPVWFSLFVCVSVAFAACSSSSSTVTSPTSTRCPVELGLSPATIDSAGGAGQVSVAVNRECTWDARSEADWITLTAPTAGQGEGTLRFSASANSLVAGRRGSIVVNDSRIEVAQSAAACRFDLSSTGGSIGAGGGSLAVSVAAQASCRWTAVSEVDWIRVDAGRDGEGSGAVQMSVSSNTGGARQGAVVVAGARYTVSQQAAGTTPGPPTPLPPPGCSYTLSPNIASFASAGGELSVGVQASAPACTWSAAATVPWITVATASGSGNGSTQLVAAANSGAERTGSVVIAGLAVAVTQAAAPPPTCEFTVAPRAADVAHGGGEGTVTVRTATASCSWSAASNASWITVSTSGGTGNADVRYTVAANTGAARTGTFSVAGVLVTISQAAAPAPPACEYDISPRSESFGATGGEGTIRIRPSAGTCAWTVTSNAPWVSVTGGSGTGNGDVRYTVAANTGAARSGTLSVGGVTITISQEAVPAPTCEYDISPRSEPFGAPGGEGTIRVRPSANSCAWTAASNAAWIVITAGSGTGNGDVRYTVAANTGGARSGTITVAGVAVTIAQEAAPPPPPACTFDATPRTESYNALGGSGEVTVTASADSCAWTATSNAAWISVGSAGGTGRGEVRYTVQSNLIGTARTGTLTVAGITITISQSVLLPAPGELAGTIGRLTPVAMRDSDN